MAPSIQGWECNTTVSFNCYEDCCTFGEQFCRESTKKCQHCSTFQVYCGIPEKISHACDAFCKDYLAKIVTNITSTLAADNTTAADTERGTQPHAEVCPATWGLIPLAILLIISVIWTVVLLVQRKGQKSKTDRDYPKIAKTADLFTSLVSADADSAADSDSNNSGTCSSRASYTQTDECPAPCFRDSRLDCIPPSDAETYSGRPYGQQV